MHPRLVVTDGWRLKDVEVMKYYESSVTSSYINSKISFTLWQFLKTIDQQY